MSYNLMLNYWDINPNICSWTLHKQHFKLNSLCRTTYKLHFVRNMCRLTWVLKTLPAGNFHARAYCHCRLLHTHTHTRPNPSSSRCQLHDCTEVTTLLLHLTWFSVPTTFFASYSLKATFSLCFAILGKSPNRFNWIQVRMTAAGEEKCVHN